MLSLHPWLIFFLALFFEVFAAYWENEILDNACVKKKTPRGLSCLLSGDFLGDSGAMISEAH